MSRLVDNSITIYEALQNIKIGKFVMPAFQRQYVWSTEQIEKLNITTGIEGLPRVSEYDFHIQDKYISWSYVNITAEK